MSVAQAPTAPLPRFVHWLGCLPTLGRLAVCLSLGVAAWFGPSGLSVLCRVIAAWDAFAWALLLLFWMAIFTADTGRIRDVATSEDPGRLILFGIVLVGIGASLLAVLVLLRTTVHSQQQPTFLTQVGLAVGAVAGAWLLLHTVFTLRYAHLYYDPSVDGVNGLEFPGERDFEPDYLDFAYFAFTLGASSATSDVNVTGRTHRHLALLHALLSFSFNTALVALSISALGGVL